MAFSKRQTVTTSGATVTLTGPMKSWEYVEVVNLDGAGIVSIKLEGTAVLAADDLDAELPATAGASVVLPVPGDADADGNIDVGLDASATTEVRCTLLRGNQL